MGVNLATIAEYYFRRREGKPRIIADSAFPASGFLFCLAIWLSLPMPARFAGGTWLLIGLIYDAVKIARTFFRRSPAVIDFNDHTEESNHE